MPKTIKQSRRTLVKPNLRALQKAFKDADAQWTSAKKRTREAKEQSKQAKKVMKRARKALRDAQEKVAAQAAQKSAAAAKTTARRNSAPARAARSKGGARAASTSRKETTSVPRVRIAESPETVRRRPTRKKPAAVAPDNSANDPAFLQAHSDQNAKMPAEMPEVSDDSSAE